MCIRDSLVDMILKQYIPEFQKMEKGIEPVSYTHLDVYKETGPEVSSMIKKCNDFGAGGVSVAIGELAAGLQIDLDRVPKKYAGLDGTEIAISESQAVSYTHLYDSKGTILAVYYLGD